MGKRGRGPSDPNDFTQAFEELAFQKQGYLVTQG